MNAKSSHRITAAPRHPGIRLGRLRSAWLFLLLLPASCFLLPLLAFPPAPHHLLFGLVRDEYGNPLTATATLILESAAGVQVLGEVVPNRGVGLNYQLKVPMDAGLTLDAYQPTALRPNVPFKIKVRVGTLDYYPIEMVGNFKLLGQPGKETRLDLTLGEDTDGDGLPDAWERMLIAAGRGTSLADITPSGDSDRDRMTNLQEYLAGTYAFDPANGFALTIKSINQGRPVLEFTAIRGRNYSIQSSADLRQWDAVNFRLPGDPAPRASYPATDVRRLSVEAEASVSPKVRFYRLTVQ